jgi:hypothetical protein
MKSGGKLSTLPHRFENLKRLSLAIEGDECSHDAIQSYILALPRGLESLKLCGLPFLSLTQFPAGLSRLELIFYGRKSVPQDYSQLPASLLHFNCSVSILSQEMVDLLPIGLLSLRLELQGRLSYLPPDIDYSRFSRLEKLSMYSKKSTYPFKLPKTLTKLSVNGPSSLASLFGSDSKHGTTLMNLLDLTLTDSFQSWDVTDLGRIPRSVQRIYFRRFSLAGVRVMNAEATVTLGPDLPPQLQVFSSSTLTPSSIAFLPSTLTELAVNYFTFEEHESLLLHKFRNLAGLNIYTEMAVHNLPTTDRSWPDSCTQITAHTKYFPAFPPNLRKADFVISASAADLLREGAPLDASGKLFEPRFPSTLQSLSLAFSQSAEVSFARLASLKTLTGLYITVTHKQRSGLFRRHLFPFLPASLTNLETKLMIVSRKSIKLPDHMTCLNTFTESWLAQMSSIVDNLVTITAESNAIPSSVSSYILARRTLFDFEQADFLHATSLRSLSLNVTNYSKWDLSFLNKLPPNLNFLEIQIPSSSISQSPPQIKLDEKRVAALCQQKGITFRLQQDYSF